MKKANTLLVALLCLLIETACNPEFKNTKDTQNSQTETVSSQSIDQFIKVKVQATSSPEKYMVYFSWPKIEAGKLIRIRLDKTLAVVNPSQTDFNHEVFHDQILTYTFEILDQASKIEKSFHQQVKIPKDFVVREGQTSFQENTKLIMNRVFLNDSVPLNTNGYKIEIIANELISKKGIIRQGWNL